MARCVKLLILMLLLGFVGCGVKGPLVPYVDVVAREKAAEDAKLKAAEPPPVVAPAVEPDKKIQKKKGNSKK